MCSNTKAVDVDDHSSQHADSSGKCSGAAGLRALPIYNLGAEIFSMLCAARGVQNAQRTVMDVSMNMPCTITVSMQGLTKPRQPV